MIPNRPSSSGTMARDSTWLTLRGSSAFSNGCMLPASFPGRGSAWRLCKESSIATAAVPGRPEKPTEGQLSILPCPIMTMRPPLDFSSGTVLASREHNTAAQTDETRNRTVSVKGPLQVLIVEDSENDAALLEIELQQAGYETICQRVETAGAMRAALDAQSWDVVIA